MKISLSWLFDHIDADWHSVDVAKLVADFNKTTAEIEHFYPLALDLEPLALGRIESIEQEVCKLMVPEWSSTLQLPVRTDASVGNHYLIAKQAKGHRWATSLDLGAHKEYIIPALNADDTQLAGGWKKSIDISDWIIEVDNKSINHRPDLWSHRGLARECAAILGLPMQAFEKFLIDYPIEESTAASSPLKTGSFDIAIDQPSLCKRFAGVELAMTNKPSLVWMAARLAAVDSRAIDAIVDITNYVMLDIGQPMHAFDADRLPGSHIQVRLAQAKEKLIVLDGQTVELTPQDMVVCADGQPVALAGIMGGQATGVNAATKKIFLESANFDAGMIRKTALQVKKRTEASTRFEKTIDPFLNTKALVRFIHLALNNGILDDEAPVQPIVSLGIPFEQPTITVEHAAIEKSLGVSLSVEKITSILEKLEFKVSYQDGAYLITIPSFRATKDVAIAQDIVEEIGRFVGYDSIATILPMRFMAPFDLSSVQRVRALKEIMAFGIDMHEVYNYALHDQEFLRLIGYQPNHAAQVMSPVSENWRLLATSLIPGLLKNVHDNAAMRDQLRFFELARVWQTKGDSVIESKRLAGIFYSKTAPIDFYQAKAELQKLFDGIGAHVSWRQSSSISLPWFIPYQTADLVHEGTVIGSFGKVPPALVHLLALGDACVFELDAQFLIEYRRPHKNFVQLSKFQSIDRDVSMLVPLALTVDELAQIIKNSDHRITEVALRDIFQKDDWHDQKSVTFRFIITDHEKILSKEESEAIALTVAENLKKLGAQIR